MPLWRFHADWERVSRWPLSPRIFRASLWSQYAGAPARSGVKTPDRFAYIFLFILFHFVLPACYYFEIDYIFIFHIVDITLAFICRFLKMPGVIWREALPACEIFFRAKRAFFFMIAAITPFIISRRAMPSYFWRWYAPGRYVIHEFDDNVSWRRHVEDILSTMLRYWFIYFLAYFTFSIWENIAYSLLSHAARDLHSPQPLSAIAILTAYFLFIFTGK